MADIPGAPGSDILFGTPEGDRIAGRAGSDWLAGLAGNDILEGGQGSRMRNRRLSGRRASETMHPLQRAEDRPL